MTLDDFIATYENRPDPRGSLVPNDAYPRRQRRELLDLRDDRIRHRGRVELLDELVPLAIPIDGFEAPAMRVEVHRMTNRVSGEIDYPENERAGHARAEGEDL